MTLIKYSKTRRVYWTNTLSKTSDSDAGITIIAPAEGTPVNYGVGQIAGSIHNWHHVPMNHYGLYCTTAEMQSLLAYSKSITPKCAKVTVGHSIPLSQYPGSANALQLSFNNTIFTLMYHLQKQIYCQPMNDFATIKDFYDFVRTFDGHRYIDSTAQPASRQVLPKPNLRFIYPKGDYIAGHEGSAGAVNSYQREITIVNNMNSSSTTTSINNYLARPTDQYNTFAAYENNNADMPLLEGDLANGYAPEFLQDNENLKALYPGENIDEHILCPEHNEIYTIKNGETLLNQIWTNRDIRAIFRDSNLTYNDAVYLYLNVFPVCKGPADSFDLTANQVTNYPAIFRGDNTAGNAQKQAQIFLENMIHNLTGLQYKDMFTDSLSHLFIKGNEILDPNGALVNHQFQGTVTWELDVEVQEQIYSPLMNCDNKLKWINVYKQMQRVITPNASPSTDAVTYRTKYTKGNPINMLNDNMLASTPIYCRSYALTNNVSINTENQTVSQISTPGTNFISTLPTGPESQFTRWSASLSSIPTETMFPEGGNGGPPALNTRSKHKVSSKPTEPSA